MCFSIQLVLIILIIFLEFMLFVEELVESTILIMELDVDP